ncbi:MAG: Cell division protein FtsW [Parcubacteria group bacterium]|nr:Cell division protein FtsW [Parcubacteria group bacterium]
MRILAGDRLFFFIVLILVVGGAAMFLSAALGLLARQNADLGHLAITQLVLGLIPGLIALVIIRFTPQKLFMRGILPFYIFAVLATILVFIPHVGVHTNGATRWLQVGPVTVQPAEFLKIAVVLMFASYLAKMRSKLSDMRYGLLGFGVIVGIPAALLVMQPNTSTLLVLGATTAAMYFIAGAPWRDFAVLLVVALVGLGIIIAARPYVLQRIQTFVHPADNSLTSGYQIQQSLIAVGSGGLLGRGFGQSVQKFNYLPAAVDDAIFAVYAEEFGFVGAVFLVLLFLAFAARGLMIAAEASNAFGTFAATGLTLIITISAFLNIGAMLSIFPLTGLPLPFISHGGTALLAALASIGVILNIAANRAKKRTR